MHVYMLTADTRENKEFNVPKIVPLWLQFDREQCSGCALFSLEWTFTEGISKTFMTPASHSSMSMQ